MSCRSSLLARLIAVALLIVLAAPIAPLPLTTPQAAAATADADRDGIDDATDNCPPGGTTSTYNPEQRDADSDGKGDRCDPWPRGTDPDDDGLTGAPGPMQDLCPLVFSPWRLDYDFDGQGDECDPNPFGHSWNHWWDIVVRDQQGRPVYVPGHPVKFRVTETYTSLYSDPPGSSTTETYELWVNNYHGGVFGTSRESLDPYPLNPDSISYVQIDGPASCSMAPPGAFDFSAGSWDRVSVFLTCSGFDLRVVDENGHSADGACAAFQHEGSPDWTWACDQDDSAGKVFDGRIVYRSLAGLVTARLSTDLGGLPDSCYARDALTGDPLTVDRDVSGGTFSTATRQIRCLAPSHVDVTMTSDPHIIEVGDQVAFHWSLTNNGPGDLPGAILKAVLPAELAKVKVMPGLGGCSGTRTITCNLGTIPVGTDVASVDFTLAGTAIKSPDDHTVTLQPLLTHSGVIPWPSYYNPSGYTGIFEYGLPHVVSETNPSPTLQGWFNTDVGVRMHTLDNDGGSGPVGVRYVGIGAQEFPLTTGDIDQTVTITNEGITTVRAWGVDVAGHIGNPTSTIVRIDRQAPSVGRPVATLMKSVTDAYGQNKLRVYVRWNAEDNGPAGVYSYEFSYRKTPIGYMTMYTQTNSLYLQLDPGEYQFKVRAVDKAGNWSGERESALVQLALNQEDSGVTYAGNWTRVALGQASGGYVMRSATLQDSATFTFTGRSISWVATLGPYAGKARVYLDGNLTTPVATIDLYASSLQPRRAVWTKTFAASGAHTITIEVVLKNATSAGNRVDVDEFAIVS